MESSLYLPVKRFLEKLGFEVKGEICGCDLVALDGNEPTAVVWANRRLDRAHDRAHAYGFYSRREHRAYHRALRDFHRNFHDDHPGTWHDHRRH